MAARESPAECGKNARRALADLAAITMETMQNNAGTSRSFERVEVRPTRPANSGRAGLIRAATHRWRMSG
jgi:hypothetical protein